MSLLPNVLTVRLHFLVCMFYSSDSTKYIILILNGGGKKQKKYVINSHQYFSIPPCATHIPSCIYYW